MLTNKLYELFYSILTTFSPYLFYNYFTVDLLKIFNTKTFLNIFHIRNQNDYKMHDILINIMNMFLFYYKNKNHNSNILMFFDYFAKYLDKINDYKFNKQVKSIYKVHNGGVIYNQEIKNGSTYQIYYCFIKIIFKKYTNRIILYNKTLLFLYVPIYILKELDQVKTIFLILYKKIVNLNVENINYISDYKNLYYKFKIVIIEKNHKKIVSDGSNFINIGIMNIFWNYIYPETYKIRIIKNNNKEICFDNNKYRKNEIFLKFLINIIKIYVPGVIFLNQYFNEKCYSEIKNILITYKTSSNKYNKKVYNKFKNKSIKYKLHDINIKKNKFYVSIRNTLKQNIIYIFKFIKLIFNYIIKMG